MRQIVYLSPSAINTFFRDRDEFYMNYLCEHRPPRMAQNRAMSIGSAFDAYAKSFLHEKLFGLTDGRFELTTLFEAQVEKQNRDWAWENGKYVFDCYCKSGAIGDLLIDLQKAIGSPRFEFEVKGVINGEREGVTKTTQGVTLLGKPDIFYINKEGVHVILDFKVNGYCSRSAVSPKPGYLRLRSGSGQHGVSGPHKDCMAMNWRGSMINVASYLEDIDKDWATQLAIYSWLCGTEIGEESIIAIDQLVCKPIASGNPEIRVAEHRTRVHPDYQWKTFAAIQTVWDIVRSNHIFRELSQEQSEAKCEMLDMQAINLKQPQTEEDILFREISGGR